LLRNRLLKFENEQRPKYPEAYLQMRKLIPPNITKTRLKRMISEGIPTAIANRIWETKALWLICMHSDDIHKVFLPYIYQDRFVLCC